MNLIERGSNLIATMVFRFAGRLYRPGDSFDYRRLSIVHRRTVAMMLKMKKLDELSQASMERALRIRDPEAGPPRGFTLAGLLGLGVLTMEQIEAHGWGARNPEAEITDESEEGGSAWEAPEGSWKVFAEGVTEERSTDDTTLWIVPFKTGGPPRYFVHGLDGANLNGVGSIGGKARAEEWARKFMADRAAQKAAAREGDPDWSAFPEKEDDWSDDQIAEFDAWYDALQPGAEVVVEHAAVTKLVAERREAEAKEADILKENAAGASGETATDQDANAIGLNDQEINELLEAMTDEELVAHVAQLTGTDPELLKGLTPLALREMAADYLPSTEGNQPNDRNIQPGPDGDAG